MKQPSSTELKAIDAFSSQYDYWCGDPLFDAEPEGEQAELKKIFFVKEAMSCRDIVEPNFFNSSSSALLRDRLRLDASMPPSFLWMPCSTPSHHLPRECRSSSRNCAPVLLTRHSCYRASAQHYLYQAATATLAARQLGGMTGTGCRALL